MKVNTFRNTATLAFSVAFAAAVMAQSPSPQTPQTPPTTRPAPETQQRQDNLKSMIGKSVTLSGCLAEEKAVTGQTPNVTERAGAAPDYILTNVQVKASAPAAAATTGAPQTPSAAGTTGGLMPAMKVKLKQVDNDEMRANLNKRLEVTGHLQAAKAPSTGVAGAVSEVARGGGPNEPLPEVHVTNVRALDQTCTPTR
jgi:hypothetical protein